MIVSVIDSPILSTSLQSASTFSPCTEMKLFAAEDGNLTIRGMLNLYLFILPGSPIEIKKKTLLQERPGPR